MIGREFGRAPEGQFARSSQRARMVSQSISQPDPQDGVSWVLAHRRLENAGGLLRMPTARIGFRNDQPMLGRPKAPEKGVADIRERDRSGSFLCIPWRRRQTRTTIHGITRGTKEECGASELERRAAEAH